MSAVYRVGDCFDLIAALDDGSVDCVVTSPPYLRQRAYLPPGHPAKDREIGQEDTPGGFLEVLLDLMDALWPKLTEHGTFWVNLGDKQAGSGGAGGDYNEGGLRDGQEKFGPVPSGDAWPSAQSACWTPHLFGASLAYGRNLLTGTPHRRWVTRPPVTWCKPNPQPGREGRKFRSATELIVFGGKHEGHYFDLDAVRDPHDRDFPVWNQTGPKQRLATDRSDPVTGKARYTKRTVNPLGKPPLNYWEVPSDPYDGAHFAVFPPSLIVKPVIAGCPPGGLILDPFAGSGTTLAVATGHNRNALGFDLDERNAWLARERVGLWLEVDLPTAEASA